MRDYKGRSPKVTQALGVGLVASDPAGQLISVGLEGGAARGIPDTIGGGDVSAAANIGDNRIVRGDGGAKSIQQSANTAEDDGRISSVTDPTGAQDAATKHYVDAVTGGGGAAFYMEPLATGPDPATSELVWAPNGDVVSVPVYF